MSAFRNRAGPLILSPILSQGLFSHLHVSVCERATTMRGVKGYQDWLWDVSIQKHSWAILRLRATVPTERGGVWLQPLVGQDGLGVWAHQSFHQRGSFFSVGSPHHPSWHTCRAECQVLGVIQRVRAPSMQGLGEARAPFTRHLAGIQVS